MQTPAQVTVSALIGQRGKLIASQEVPKHPLVFLLPCKPAASAKVKPEPTQPIILVTLAHVWSYLPPPTLAIPSQKGCVEVLLHSRTSMLSGGFILCAFALFPAPLHTGG